MSYLVRFVGGLLRVRYLVLGSAVGGGVGLSQKYEDWKKNLPDLPDVEWLRSLLPSEDSLNEFKSGMNNLKNSITLEEWSRELSQKSKDTLKTFNDWVEEANRNIKTSGNNGLLILGMGPPIPPKNFEKDKESKSLLPDIQFFSKKDYGQDTMDDKIYELETKLREFRKVIDISDKEIHKLRKENEDLKNRIVRNSAGTVQQKKMLDKSLIELYSEILDELSDFDSSYNILDNLPKVVVVGDQSAGKTSVLEMIAGARIFPRGAGEMMTRSPVQVTLSEGPYHVARFNDTSREFDLTKETELSDLRHEIESRMKRSVQTGKTVSNQVISLTIQGPGLKRMVLVDLPGIIGTVTNDLAPDTKESIIKMAEEYMGNPNAIILCIQDGSLDAERSIFTDLVHKVDEKGRRTILVLTKVDLAEKEHTNPDKIKKILDGRLFPIKAIGYFAVVAGKSGKNENIQDIKDYEKHFFDNSTLCAKGILNKSQCTTENLSAEVSGCFWSMVRASVEQQTDAYKATLFNLEAEWNHSFPYIRQLSRDELFLNAKNELLDELVELSRFSTIYWDKLLSSRLWQKFRQHVFEEIYYPASCDQSQFNAKIEIELQRWVEVLCLPKQAIQVAQEAIKDDFYRIDDRKNKEASDEAVYSSLKRTVIDDALSRHTWKPQAVDVLKVVQLEARAKQTNLNQENWEKAIEFLKKSLNEEIVAAQQELTQLTGPGFIDQWTSWKYVSQEQTTNSKIKAELGKIIQLNYDSKPIPYMPQLPQADLTTIKRTLESSHGIIVDDNSILMVWRPFQKLMFLKSEINRANECKKEIPLYEHDIGCNTDRSPIILFYRIQRMLEFTSNSLRRQLVEDEFKRIERKIIEVFNEYSENDELKTQLLHGRQVHLVEEINKVRRIIGMLEYFVEAMNKEERPERKEQL